MEPGLLGGCYVTAGSRKLGKNFKKMIPLYEFFSRDWKHCLDFSDEMLWELYQYESSGIGSVSTQNGFGQGKKWMDVAVAQWREDLWRTLFPWELYSDPDLPDWWLDKVLCTKWKKLNILV